MKNAIFLIFLLSSFSFNSFSQIEKNTWMIGGSASFDNQYTKSTNITSTSLKINPQFGFFFADNFAVGTLFGINNSKYFRSWSVSPFLRYYLKSFYAEVSYGFEQHKVVNYSKNNSSVLKGSIGYALFLNDNVALEPSFYYSPSFNDGDYYGSSYGLQIGLQIYLNR